jgi:hypothetical protein
MLHVFVWGWTLQTFCKILPALTVSVRQPRAGAVSLGGLAALSPLLVRMHPSRATLINTRDRQRRGFVPSPTYSAIARVLLPRFNGA